MFAQNQQLGLALAASAAGFALARKAVEDDHDSPAARTVRSLGRLHVGVVDAGMGVVDRVRARALRAEERRKAEERDRWLRQNTRAARIVKPEYA
jgi:hypothetical protein